MKPIYVSPERSQAEAVKQTLMRHGIHASLVRQQEPHNALVPQGVTWYELWVKDESTLARAKALVKQHEFGILKDSLNAKSANQAAFYEPPQPKSESFQEAPAANGTKTSNTPNINTRNNGRNNGNGDSDKLDRATLDRNIKTALDNLARNATKQELLEMTQDSGLPVNNQKVFHRLAGMLGFSEDEINDGKHNNIRRPWNGDRLNDQVKALQQICKGKSSTEAVSS
jgi:hypothetical protein